LKESISKKNWGQYFTPLKVVRSIVNMADIEPGMKICDPACGVGKFLLEPILHNLNQLYDVVENKELRSQIFLYGFDKGFDRDEQKTIILAKANMLIYMSNLIKEHPNLTKQFAELFNKTFTLQTNSILGTLSNPTTEEYDLILTNPPYVMSGSSNLKEEISKDNTLKQYFSVNAMGIEGLFMEWIIRALKVGKKAFIVVPDGIMNRSNDKKLRDFILEQCNIDAVISLPLNTFFTTNKKTYILVLSKKVPITLEGVASLPKQNTPVFTYLCSEIGETRDVYRFDIEQNDLEVASDLFNMFKGAKSKFKTEDKRCKIVDIDNFYNGSHWSVDRWWSRDEKIELGIEDNVDAVSLEDYISMISDTANILMEFDEPLRELEKKKSKVLNFVEVSLDDSTLFDLSIGKRLLRKNYIESSGDIPAYSSNVMTPFVYTTTSNIEDFTVPYVLWGIDGSFEFNVMPKGKKFSHTDHCGVIKIKNSKINPYYLSYILEENKHKYGFDRGLRASLLNMKSIKVAIPIDCSGEFDEVAQENIVDSLLGMRQLRENLLEKRLNFAKIKVVLEDENYRYNYFPLASILEAKKGLSIYTKKYGNLHSGPYPVYSASSKKALTYINTFDYDGKYLTWATNGFAGTILVLNEKFSINGDRGVLIPKNNRTDIDLDYMKFVLEPLFRDLAKGRKGDNGEDEFTKLYPSMLDDIMLPIPINEEGNIDLCAQKEIVFKYLAIEHSKDEVISKLDTLINQQIEL